MKRLLLLAVIGVLLSGRVGAVTVSVHSYDNSFSADAVIDGTTHWVYTGAVYLNISGLSTPQEGWCVDLKQVVASTAWNAVQKSTLPTALDDGRRADWAMGLLWKNRPSASTARERAALQIAIWEALYDGFGSNPFSSGRFKVANVFQGANRGATETSLLALAESYLNNWAGVAVLNGSLLDAPLPGSSTRSQDFLLTPPTNFTPLVVPEGGTLALLLSGLLATLLSKRRTLRD